MMSNVVIVDQTLGVAMMDPEDDVYIYGTMETDNNATWKHEGDSLKIKENLTEAKGRFADLKFGELTLPNGKTKRVVVKLNKRKSGRPRSKLTLLNEE